MNVSKQVHISYFALLALLLATVAFATFGPDSLKELSTWGFAIAKSLIILFVFMKVGSTQRLSLIYILMALGLIAILVLITLDDTLFRG